MQPQTAKPPIREIVIYHTDGRTNEEDDVNPQIEQQISDPDEEPVGSKELR